MSVITAATYARDKYAARHRLWRVRERTLWLLTLLGGAPGAWLAFFGLRHKTRHASFWLIQSVALALQVALLLALLPRR